MILIFLADRPQKMNGSTGFTVIQPVTPHYFLGDLISGTYCSRIFNDCDQHECRLQSPNFPGMYPRNLTCYYAVRQHPVPPGKHALISIRQKNGQLLSIQSIQYAENKHETKLKVRNILYYKINPILSIHEALCIPREGLTFVIMSCTRIVQMGYIKW